MSSKGQRLPCERLEDRLTPTTIVVTTAADTFAPDHFVSLWEAIQAASTNAAVNEAPAGLAGKLDVINLTSSLPDVTAAVAIDGLTQPGTNPSDANYFISAALDGNPGDGVRIDGKDNFVNGGHGAQITGSSNRVFGTFAPAGTHLISGKPLDGVRIATGTNTGLTAGAVRRNRPQADGRRMAGGHTQRVPHLNLTRFYSQADPAAKDEGQRARRAGHALSLLRRARKAGILDDAAAVGALARNPDLHLLARRDDVRQFLATLNPARPAGKLVDPPRK